MREKRKATEELLQGRQVKFSKIKDTRYVLPDEMTIDVEQQNSQTLDSQPDSQPINDIIDSNIAYRATHKSPKRLIDEIAKEEDEEKREKLQKKLENVEQCTAASVKKGKEISSIYWRQKEIHKRIENEPDPEKRQQLEWEFEKLQTQRQQLKAKSTVLKSLEKPAAHPRINASSSSDIQR